MSKTVQFKRGNANVSASYVGAQGEITVNTDNYTLNIHDGTTAGGYSILNTNVSNIGNLVVTNQTITGTSANTNITISPTNANVVLTANLLTPNIAINRYTIQSVSSGTSLTLPASSDGANVELVNNFSNIKWTVLDSSTDVPYTVTLGTDSYLTLPGYIKSTLGGGEIQFGGTQGVLIYANFATGHTGISLSDTGVSDIFSNGDLRLSTNYSGVNKQWLFSTNGTLTTSGNTSTANLLISHVVANNTVQARTLANSDLQLTATDGIAASSIYLWANNQRMSFNTVSNAFDFNFNGQLSATDFTASKNSAYGYSFYSEGSGYSGMRHTSGPPDVITIEHEGNVFAGFYGNYTTEIFGNLVVSSDGQSFGSFPNAYAQIYSNVNSYAQLILQNINDGELSTADLVVTSDNGNDASYYVDLGITGGNHADPDFFGDTVSVNDAYLYVTGYDQTGPSLGNIGNLIIGSTNGIVKTFIGNTAEANVVTIVNSTGLLPGANVVYNLGSEANQWKDLWLSNSTIYLGGVPITVTANGQLSVNGSPVSGGGGLPLTNGTSNINIPNVDGNVVITANGTTSWQFETDGSLTLPTVLPGDTSIGTAFNTNPPGHTLTLKHNGGVSGGSGGELKFDYGNVNIKVVKDAGTTQTWTFGTDGTILLPAGATIAESTYLSANSIRLKPSGNISSQYLEIAPTAADGNHIHLMAGSGTDLFLGDDNQYVKLANTGGVIINSNDGAGNIAQWTFGANSQLTVPGAILTASASKLDLVGFGSNTAYLTTTADDSTALFMGAVVVDLRASDSISITTNTDSTSYQWTFDETGNLALPSGGLLLVSGGIVAGPVVASPAPYLSGFGSISSQTMTASGNITAGNINSNVNGFAIGYRDIPQVVFTSNSTLALTDAGKHYYSANSANVITIPNNATVSFNIGTAVSIVQQGTANLTITPGSGVTLYLAGNSVSASRTVGNFGMATLMKVATDTWFINGTGVN